MTTTNFDVKIEAIKNGVKLYEIPAELKMSMTKFNHLMCVPLNAENKQKILEAIKAIAANR